MRTTHALLLAVALAVPARAAVFRDVAYVRSVVDAPAQSLDVYTPATPGSHAVVLYLDGRADKGATRGRHAVFNARGIVFVSANVRRDPHTAASDDIVELLAWAQRYASRYGGDPERIYLLATGAAAPIALAAADDPARRAGASLPAGTPAGIVVLAPAALPDAVAADAPRLVLFDANDEAMRERVDGYVERARGAGVAALALPAVANGADAVERDFGTPTDPDAELVLDWLDSRAIARVPRFEQLVFATEPVPFEASRVAGLVALDDTLLVAGSGPDGTARIAGRAASARDWTAEAEWPQAHIFVLAAGGGDAHALRGVGANFDWCTRAGGAWTCAPVTGLAGDSPAQAVLADGAWHVATSGEGGAVFRLVVEGDGFAARRAEPLAARDARIVACGDALFFAAGGMLWRRHLSHWHRVAQWLSGAPDAREARSLACVPDPAGSGRDAIVAALADGRVLRIDAGGGVVLELDAAAAFRELWRDPGLAASFAAAPVVALRQSDSGDLVHAIALAFPSVATRRPGGYWLLRALDASYAYGVLRDFAAPDPGAAPALFAAGAAQVVVVAPAATQAYLLRGELPPRGPRTGLWWDPARPGEAIELAHDGEAWNAIVHDHGRDGMTRWTQHTGTLSGGEFVEGGDVAREGALRIAFGGNGTVCPAPRAAASMSRDDSTTRWCIEPFVLPRAGKPTIDGSGTWRSNAEGEHWELSTAAQGYDGDTTSWVMLRWMDDQERRRWLFGVAPQARGALRVTLDAGHCPHCGDGATAALDLHWFGACGEGDGIATLEVRDAGRIVLRRKDIAIDAVARQPCY